MNKRNQVIKIAKIIILNVLFFFTVYYAWRYFSNIIVDWESPEKLDSRYLILSVFMFFVFYFLLSVGWQKVLSLYSKDKEIIIPIRMSFFASQIFKYLPTSLFSFSSRIYFLKKVGINVAMSINAIILENAFIIISSLLVFLLFSFNWAISIIIIVSIIIGYYAYLFLLNMHNKGKVLFSKLLFFLPEEKISKKQYVSLWFIYIISWLFAGLSLYFLQFAIGETSVNIYSIVSFQSMSYSASILAIFAPGGIGVREIVLQKANLSDVSILIWRVGTFIFDIIVGCAGMIYFNMLVRKKVPK